MSKYIDAEKLTKFEETLADIIVSSQGLCTYEACKDVAKSEAPFLIASLQQEQTEVDLENEIKIERAILLDDAFGPMNGEQSLAIRNFARHFYELGKIARKEK